MCLQVCRCVHLSADVCMCMQVYMQLCMCVHVYMHVYVCTCTVHMCIHVCMCVDVCMALQVLAARKSRIVPHPTFPHCWLLLRSATSPLRPYTQLPRSQARQLGFLMFPLVQQPGCPPWHRLSINTVTSLPREQAELGWGWATQGSLSLLPLERGCAGSWPSRDQLDPVEPFPGTVLLPHYPAPR